MNFIQQEYKEIATYLNQNPGLDVGEINQITSHLFISNLDNVINKSLKSYKFHLLMDFSRVELNKNFKQKYVKFIIGPDNLNQICNLTYKIIQDCIKNNKKILLFNENGDNEVVVILAYYILRRNSLMEFNNIELDKLKRKLNEFKSKRVIEFIKTARPSVTLNKMCIEYILYMESIMKKQLLTLIGEPEEDSSSSYDDVDDVYETLDNLN